MKVATVSATLLVMIFLLTFSSGNGQTFQYSRGWTNGKRSDPFQMYGKHTDAPWNPEDVAARFRSLWLIQNWLFVWISLFISFMVKAMGTLSCAGTTTTNRLPCVRIRFNTERLNSPFGCFDSIESVSATTSETWGRFDCGKWFVAGQSQRNRWSLQAKIGCRGSFGINCDDCISAMNNAVACEWWRLSLWVH